MTGWKIHHFQEEIYLQRELTYISLTKAMLKMIFPFPQVGYVNFQENISSKGGFSIAMLVYQSVSA